MKEDKFIAIAVICKGFKETDRKWKEFAAICKGFKEKTSIVAATCQGFKRIRLKPLCIAATIEANA